MQSLALSMLFPAIALLLAIDTRRRASVSSAVWVVVLWLVLISSRPVTTWFDLGASLAAAESYDEGSPFDRVAYFALMLLAFATLARRGVRLREVAASNRWLAVFMLYWFVSIFWADSPLIASKRWLKEIGNVLMVLVVLSEERRADAIAAVFTRSACLLLPTSVVFIRFFPELGRTYHVWSGEMMYTGVATHKNSLGVLVLVSLGCLAWDSFSRATSPPSKRPFAARASSLALLGMAVWLLLKAESATANGCCALALALLAALHWPPLRARAWALQVFGGLVALLAWSTGIVPRATEFMIVDVLRRDLTLTTRTDVWPMLIGKAENAWLGSGFNSFWSGERLAEIYRQLGIIQAHNGYLETYLNGGLIGVVLLGCVLIAAVRHVNRGLASGGEAAPLAFAIICITVVYNCTEASFSKMSPLWFAFLLLAMRYREAPTATKVPATRSLPQDKPPLLQAPW